jgi:hypothetical protein
VRRLAALRSWGRTEVAMQRRPRKSILRHQGLDGHPRRAFAPQLGLLQRGKFALASMRASGIGRRPCRRIGYRGAFLADTGGSPCVSVSVAVSVSVT